MKKILITILVVLLFGLIMPKFCLATSDIGGYWKLNGNATDYSGQGQNGVDAGTSSTTYGTLYGRYGQGALDTSNGATLKLSQPSFDWGVGDWTLSVWAYPIATIGSNYVYYHGYSSNNYCIAIRTGTGPSQWWFYAGGGSGCYGTGSNGTVTANKWYYLTLTRTGGNLYFYVNGVFDKSRTGLSTGSNFKQGDSYIMSQTAAAYFPGYVDELVIDTSLWSAQKVKTMYSYYKGIF